MKVPNIGIIGSGSWATALAKLLLNNCLHINWFIRSKTDIDNFKQFGNNPKYLSSVDFEISKINFTDSVRECVQKSDYLILAVPSAFLNDTFNAVQKSDLHNKVVFSAIKGIIPEYNLIVGEYLNTVYEIPLENIGVMTLVVYIKET